jgi:hypothetical protein
LVLAWAVALVGLRSTPMPIMIGAGAIIGGTLLILGYLFRPDAVRPIIPAYVGKIEAEKIDLCCRLKIVKPQG